MEYTIWANYIIANKMYIRREITSFDASSAKCQWIMSKFQWVFFLWHYAKNKTFQYFVFHFYDNDSSERSKFFTFIFSHNIHLILFGRFIVPNEIWIDKYKLITYCNLMNWLDNFICCIKVYLIKYKMKCKTFLYAN